MLHDFAGPEKLWGSAGPFNKLFTICETFCRTFLQNPENSAEFWGTSGSCGPSFQAIQILLPSRGPKKGAFGKPCLSPAKTRGFLTKTAKITNLRSNGNLTSKTRALQLRPRETTKTTKTAGVTRAKAWFNKGTLFCSLAIILLHEERVRRTAKMKLIIALSPPTVPPLEAL